jgi:hypothetical protein
MPALKNQRHECFAQALAAGKSASSAYEEAGYVPNRGNASTLKAKQNIIDRVTELHGQKQDRLVLSRQYVVDALLEITEKALGRKPVKIGTDGREVYVYRGDVANRAIHLAGLECGMFTNRKEVEHFNEYEKLSDIELVQLVAREAEALLLKHQSGGPDDSAEGVP